MAALCVLLFAPYASAASVFAAHAPPDTASDGCGSEVVGAVVGVVDLVLGFLVVEVFCC